MISATSLGPLPADLRNADARTQQTYRAAQGFEQLLVSQLASQLVPQDSGAYQGLLGDALTQGIMDGGGLGLARQIAEGLGR